MTNFKATLLGAAALVGIVAGAGQAQAGAYAYSLVEFRNLTVNGLGVNFGCAGKDCTFNGSTSASINGLNSPGGAPDLQQQNTPSLTANIDPTHAFRDESASLNVAGLGQNNFTTLGSTPGAGIANASFARADQFIASTSVNTFTNPAAAGAWQGVTESAVIGNRDGQANSGNVQNWDFAGIGLASATTVTVVFDYNLDMFAELAGPGALNATSTWAFGIRFDRLGGAAGDATGSITGLVSANPDSTESATDEDLAALALVSAGNSVSCVASGIADFTRCTFTFNLIAGDYNLIINDSISSQVLTQAVPEPATLGLLGAGLLGLGALARRRKAA